MSTGIGFAGLGKYLSNKTLGLIKGRKKTSIEPKLKDLRNSKTNTTDYTELIQWQEKMRQRSKRTRKVIFLIILFLTVTSLGIIYYFF